MNKSNNPCFYNDAMSPSPAKDATSVAQSNYSPLRAPGLTFTLTYHLKNPRNLETSRKAIAPLSFGSNTDTGVGAISHCAQASQRSFEADITDQNSDGEESASATEDDYDGDESMNDDSEYMMVGAQQEHTLGDTFIECRSCGDIFDYSRYALWVPGYQRKLRRSLRMPSEDTHPQIVRCPGCDAENCMACEKPPHEYSCFYEHAHVVWHALCTVDDAIVQHRKVSPYKRDNKSLEAAVVKALNILLEHIPKDSKASLDYSDLIRKSLLLDQVAVTIGNMTAENRFDTVCLQSWSFIHMLSERKNLFGLLIENRLELLRDLSPGVRILGFPVSFFPVELTYDADRYAPLTYTIWSLIRRNYQSAHEYLSADTELNDKWPAVQLARNIVQLYDDLKKQSQPSELTLFMQAQQLQSFSARLEEMHRVSGTEYGAVKENIRVARSPWLVKKRGQDDGDDCDDTGGKRRKTPTQAMGHGLASENDWTASKSGGWWKIVQ
ncbi:327b2797-9905-4a05-bbb3-bc14af6ab094-CDS [Sclerotinia trifoliorum]|uniref:327b2797-9905-4a05-bbb3-bc14af6ab094-CDS n=1 Tax=Sclerotinia trifoliorum TaxID=28548 RepID=A0A8H2ZPV6_9HELO|nr:327b2797-9905-4a05-bbb3-bc14af6ab094-CDS [Sclerotinia trifoliorum]